MAMTMAMTLETMISTVVAIQERFDTMLATMTATAVAIQEQFDTMLAMMTATMGLLAVPRY